MGKPAILSYLETHDRLLMIMQTNCVPEEDFNMEEKDYHNFLDKRRKLMAKKIRKYYEML